MRIPGLPRRRAGDDPTAASPAAPGAGDPSPSPSSAPPAAAPPATAAGTAAPAGASRPGAAVGAKRPSSSATSGRFTIGLGPNGAERTAILGRPGSGKTTLARLLVGSYGSLVAIDPKHRLELPLTTTVYGAAEFRNTWPQRGRRVILRPAVDTDDELRADVDEALRRVFRYGRTAVLIDEAVDLAPRSKIVPAYRRLLRLGRELLIPVYSCSQRPIDLHNDVLATADHLIVFDLPLEGDRRKAAGIAGDELLERADDRFDREHGFAYAGPATRGRVVWCEPLELSASQLPRPPANVQAPTGGPTGG